MMRDIIKKLKEKKNNSDMVNSIFQSYEQEPNDVQCQDMGLSVQALIMIETLRMLKAKGQTLLNCLLVVLAICPAGLSLKQIKTMGNWILKDGKDDFMPEHGGRAKAKSLK